LAFACGLARWAVLVSPATSLESVLAFRDACALPGLNQVTGIRVRPRHDRDDLPAGASSRAAKFDTIEPVGGGGGEVGHPGLADGILVTSKVFQLARLIRFR